MLAFDFSSRRGIFPERTVDLVGDAIPLSHIGAQWGHFLDLLLELVQDLFHGQAFAFCKSSQINFRDEPQRKTVEKYRAKIQIFLTGLPFIFCQIFQVIFK